MERTGAGDPERTVALLWREGPGDAPRRGPKARVALDDVVRAAVDLADAEGLGAVSLRRLAALVGLASPAALYTYVPTKAELVDLMVDACFAELDLVVGARAGIARRIRAIADGNLAVHRAHPWLAEVSADRPPLGPGQLRKYELELRALDGIGLRDVEMDLVLGLVLSFVRATALADHGAASAEDEQGWWAAAGPALARHVGPEDFPLASRVGTAAGEQHGRAHDPEAAYAFGLERIADGVQALVRRRARR